jgi:competence protein ComEA
VKKSQLLIAIAVLLSMCVSAFAATPAAGVVNINTAGISELVNLPRIGVKAAQRIVDYRTEHGPFHKTTDLLQVKGFGEKRYSQLSAYVTVSGNTTLTEKVRSPRKPRTKKPATTAAM